MNSSLPTIQGKQRYRLPYRYLLIAAGAVACLSSTFYLSVSQLRYEFLLLAVLTLVISTRVAVKLPGAQGGEITVSDTFLFLTILLFSGEAAILLAAAEGAASSRRISRQPLTIMFNTAVMAVSTSLTVCALRLCFGTNPLQGSYSPARLVMTVCVMSLVQYAVNSGVVALDSSLKGGAGFWEVWKNKYLWTSLTYFVGAAAAAVITVLVHSVGYLAIVSAAPVIAILYFTYRVYLKNLEVTQSHAEQAERHVEELNVYIAEQERIREQFSQVEKMSALGQLSSGVAHDFNNCLAAILGRAELLMAQTQDPKVRGGLEIIIKASEDGARTVKRIQDFARQRSDHNFVAVVVDQILSDVSEMTRPRWKVSAEAANVHIDLELRNHSGALVMGDVSELRDVLVNIVFNAVDAMPAGGRLTLASELAGDSVVISVGDTGTGMDPEVRARVFDPFFTTKGVQGMGLGLAVGYGVVTRHAGTITVESEVGRGTIFRIELPAAGLAADFKAEPGAAAAPSSRLDMKKILVVDDEPAVRNLLCDILESHGCEVRAASNGREGLALFEAESFDAVCTDVGMPGMSGWELARTIRERDEQVPVAVITGWGELVSTDEKEQARVDWVFTKPFSMKQLDEIVKEVTRRQEEGLRNSALPALVA